MNHRTRRIEVLFALALPLVCLTGPAAEGTVTLNVNVVEDIADATPGDGFCRTAPGGPCTLRAATMEGSALALAGADVVINVPAGDYFLTIARTDAEGGGNGDLLMHGKIRLQGAGALLTKIDANQLDRVIYVGSGSDVVLSDLTLQNGHPPSGTPNHPGGGSGGAIYVDNSNLSLVRCVLRANQSAIASSGGGIYQLALAGSLSIIDSTLVSNLGLSHGGAIFANGIVITISGSTFDSNFASLDGAAIRLSNGTLNLTNSTIVNNSTDGSGGGVSLEGSIAKLFSSTIAGNRVDYDMNGSGSGGGVYATDSTLQMSNSILANLNPSTHANDDLQCVGSTSAASNGFNIVRAPGGCSIFGATSAADPLLANIGPFGGTTETALPQPGSPAIGGGNPGGCTDRLGAALLVDQRGVNRPIGSQCDLGAVEVEPKGDVNGDGVVSVLDVFYLINGLFAGGPVPRGRANVNGDGAITVLDVFYLVNFLFAGGAVPV